MEVMKSCWENKQNEDKMMWFKRKIEKWREENLVERDKDSTRRRVRSKAGGSFFSLKFIYLFIWLC